MRYAIIENALVINVVESEHPLAENWIADPDATAPIGGTWDGAVFHPAPAPPVAVPPSVTRFQAFAALHNAGLLKAAQAAVSAAPDPLVALAWDNAQVFERASPTVAALAVTLGLDDAHMDALFCAAAKISA